VAVAVVRHSLGAHPTRTSPMPSRLPPLSLPRNCRDPRYPDVKAMQAAVLCHELARFSQEGPQAGSSSAAAEQHQRQPQLAAAGAGRAAVSAEGRGSSLQSGQEAAGPGPGSLAAGGGGAQRGSARKRGRHVPMIVAGVSAGVGGGNMCGYVDRVFLVLQGGQPCADMFADAACRFCILPTLRVPGAWAERQSGMLYVRWCNYLCCAASFEVVLLLHVVTHTGLQLARHQVQA
jgi:hypothetical protein